MAVADAFEAMVSGRPYKDTISLNDALDELKRNSGTQFDPRVVNSFIGMVKKIKFKKYLRMLKK
jgi:amino acid ABC transporter substrate-binding protein, PAAT family (TC 3.A.1.3.-)